jgi:hypothetical protein
LSPDQWARFPRIIQPRGKRGHDIHKQPKDNGGCDSGSDCHDFYQFYRTDLALWISISGLFLGVIKIVTHALKFNGEKIIRGFPKVDSICIHQSSPLWKHDYALYAGKIRYQQD